MINNEKIVENVIKNAIYHYDINNIYRPSIDELNNKTYTCPRCRNQLRLRLRRPIMNSIYDCDCGYFLPYQNILHDEEMIQAQKEKKMNKEDIW